jgi:hypothetical protein
VQWGFDFNTRFPNFYLAVMPDMYVTYHFWPITRDLTLWQTDHYRRPMDNAAEAISWEFAKSLIRDTQREDLVTLEATQAALESGSVDSLILSDQEVAVRHHSAIVDAAVEHGN